MGLWATLEGTVSVHKDKHISLLKAAELFITQFTDEYCLKITDYKENDKGIISAFFYFSCSEDGLIAAEFFNKLLKHLKTLGCKAELKANIPYWI